ncbi:MAG: hypothetical protein SGILL_007525 [Bacillariaceae sp.]
MDKKYRDALSRGVGGHENNADGLPPYVIPGTPEETHWRQAHPDGARSKKKSFTTGSTVAHQAAQGGDLGTLKREVEKKKDLVNAKDRNGWSPIHEGVRSGHLDVVKYLVDSGADVNAMTGTGGGTPLYIAKTHLEEDNPIIAFLESLGALDVGPDL